MGQLPAGADEMLRWVEGHPPSPEEWVGLLGKAALERDQLVDALKRIVAIPDVHFAFTLGPRGSGETRGGRMNDPKTCPGCIAEAALADLDSIEV
jgi:hypothetical protein